MSSPEKEPRYFEFGGDDEPENPIHEIMHVGENLVHRTETYFIETISESAHLTKILAEGIPHYTRETAEEIKRILSRRKGA